MTREAPEVAVARIEAARLRGEVDITPVEHDVLLPPDSALAAAAEEVAG